MRVQAIARLDVILSVVHAAVEQLHLIRLQLVAVQFTNSKCDFQFIQASFQVRPSGTKASSNLLLPEPQPTAPPTGGNKLTESLVAEKRREGLAKFDGFRPHKI